MAIELNEVRYLTEDDVYHYSVDNRPLTDLASNDEILKTAIEEIQNNSGTNGADAKPISAIYRNAAGNVTGYTEGDISFTITYNPNGTVNTVVGGGVTQTVTYDGSGNVSGLTVS